MQYAEAESLMQQLEGSGYKPAAMYVDAMSAALARHDLKLAR